MDDINLNLKTKIMAQTKITLLVEAAYLLAHPDDPDEEVIKHCALVSDTIILEREIMKTGYFHVDKEKHVRWEGEAVDVGTGGFTKAVENWDFSVGIDYIIFSKRNQTDPDVNFFYPVVLEGSGNKNSKVTAKTKQDISERTYNYIIVFTVYGPSGLQKTFTIDPKLIGNP